MVRAPVEEIPAPGEPPLAYNLRVASEKARAGWEASDQTLAVLGADTEVILDCRVFGKPDSPGEAATMLRDLAGRTHQVATSVAVLRCDGQMRCEQQISEVTFAPLSEAQIQAYAASGEPLGKAGAYAIQGRAAVFVQHLAGSYTGVMGLPLYETARLLEWAEIAVQLDAAPA